MSDTGHRLENLVVHGLRNLERIQIKPQPGVNIVYGANGVGKTSLLEAVFLLGRPRSFRSGQMRDLVRNGSPGFSVYSDLVTSNRRRRLAVGFERNELDRRLDGETISAGEAARVFPVVVFEPSMHGWLEESPDYRRTLLDWYLFHVEPSFFGLWQRYRRILKQRNAALRNGSKDAFLWDEALVEHSCKLEHVRAKAIQELVPVFQSEIAELAPSLQGAAPLYKAGAEFDSDSLLRRLRSVRDRELQLKSTQLGCHRFDWRFEDEGGSLRRRASRGQQKLLLLALMMSQAKSIKIGSGLAPLVLLDDFTSELDREHQGRALTSLETISAQVFVSTLDLDALEPSWMDSAELFHVEHGRITKT